MILKDVLDIKVGVNTPVIYLGTRLVWPLTGEDADFQADLSSTTLVTGSLSVERNMQASLEATSEVTGSLSANSEILLSASLESTSELTASFIQFDMYVTSTSRPTLGGVSTMIIEEVSPDYWRAYSYEAVTYFNFDYYDNAMRTDVTEVEVIKGDTLTSLYQTFYQLQAMTDFTWNGACNATNMDSCFGYASSLVNLTVFDTSKVTTFAHCWSFCDAYTGEFPAFDYSAALDMRYAWRDASNITGFGDIYAPLCTDFNGTWSYTDALEYIGVIDSSSGQNFITAFNNAVNLVCIGGIDTTASGGNTLNMFLNCTSLIAPSIGTEQDFIEGGYAYINANPCPQSGPVPPIYLMTEALVDDGTFQYLHNSSASGVAYNGRLEHSSLSNDELEGTPWWPSNAAYPDDPLPAQGWIDLNVNGNATRQINTQWTPPENEAWVLTAIYEVVVGVSYKMYALNYHGDNTVDVWLGENVGGVEVPIALVGENIPYTPPTTAWIIQDTPPDIINITIDGIIYEMDSFTTV